jgi:methylmalonyl-CoA mutase
MTDELPLAAEFPAATRDDWLRLVRIALKDRPVERLTSKTYDGLPIEPLYPRAAGARPIAARQGPWQVMTRIDHPDPAAANAQALDDLENGATGLSLVFRGAVGDRGYGLDASKEVIARVLDGVVLDAGIALELHTGETTKDAADHVAALVKSRGIAPGAVDIRFGHDPLGAHVGGGGAPIPWRELAPRFAAHVAALARQGFRGPFAAADGRIVHDAGGSEAEELAYALSAAVAYLRALEGAGIALADARTMIGFRLAADTDQFLTIAKLRALRLLWARVEQACGLRPQPAFVSAETAWRMTSRRDPHVNMLRTTIAAFSAGVGGANAIAVLPFTAALGLPDRFARRIARNIQLLLLEESNLWRVNDPAAGSGGIEDLTGKLAAASWALFQEIERAGGAPAALEAGLIQRRVVVTRARREQAVAQRRDALTGTSDYPLLSETPADVLDAKAAPTPSYPVGVTYLPLPPMRLAEWFEQLRDASDRILAATGARPKIFLANLGTPAEFNARATFAKNFFEAGGIEAVTNDGFASDQAMTAAFRTSGAQLACLCSSDDVYAARAVDAARALASAGATHIYLAGRPKDADALKAAGVGAFIFAGCDALATLRAAHDIVGVGTRAR